jgi:thymidylate kinase
MTEKIRKIYKNKSPYYINILSKINDGDIDFVLLNYIIPDDNPGDMDILVNEYDKLSVQSILVENGFSYYTNIDSNQMLFNKYVAEIGFVQFHLFIGLTFLNKTFLSNIPKIKGIQSDVNFSFLVFLMESFYRNKFKYYVYEQYKKQVSLSNFSSYVRTTVPSSERIIDSALEIYSKEYSNNRNLKTIIIVNNFSLLSFIHNKITRKLKRIGNKEDLFVLFIGVDGSGKTLLVSELNKVLSKGGIFPLPKYLGVKNSKVFKVSSLLTSNKSRTKVSHGSRIGKKSKLDLFKKLQITLFWLEYNLRIFVQIKIRPTSAKSVNLIDRSYLDLLFYHKNNFARLLFLRYSFKPTHLIYLTGESSEIYERKQEGSRDLHENRVTFYNSLYNDIPMKKTKIDTVKNSPITCTHMILDFILHDKSNVESSS